MIFNLKPKIYENKQGRDGGDGWDIKESGEEFWNLAIYNSPELG